MGRLISWIALAFFILVVPFISWYYLKKGFDYRRALISEIVPKDSIPSLLDTSFLFRGKTTVFSKTGFTDNSVLVKGLEEQFQKVINFQLVTVDSLTGLNIIPADYLTDFFGKYGANQLILMDTAMRVRNVYNNDAQSIKKLVEHIAIVLPRQKESDIEMKK
jgi:hypothetical protein